MSRLNFIGGVASDTLRYPVHVRLSLVPELTADDVENNRGGDSVWSKTVIPSDDCEDFGGVEWPSDRAWAEAERMLSVTTTVCVLALSAAWCLMLLTALGGGVLGIRNILSAY
jgi:hypothetical protein